MDKSSSHYAIRNCADVDCRKCAFWHLCDGALRDHRKVYGWVRVTDIEDEEVRS